MKLIKEIMKDRWKPWAAAQIAGSVSNAVFMITVTFMMKTIFASFEESDRGMLVTALVILVCGLAAASLLRLIGESVQKREANTAVTGLRERLFNSLIRNKGAEEESQILFNTDIENVREFINNNFSDIVSAVIVSVSGIVLLFTANVLAGTVMSVFLVLGILNQIWYLSRQDRINENVREAKNSLYKEIRHILRAQDIIRTFHRKQYFLEQCSYKAEGMAIAEEERLKTNFRYEIVNGILQYSPTVIPFLLMFFLVSAGKIKLSEGMFILQITGNMFFYTNQFIPALLNYKKMKLSCQKITEVCAKQGGLTEEEQKEGETRMIRGNYIQVSWKDVRARYNGFRVLDGVSCEIRPNQVSLLLGPSGTGKSTLLKTLLQRVPYEGRIEVTDQDRNDISVRDWDNLISYVPQNAELFHTTIYENIWYGDREKSREQVIAAARKATADEFITELSEGYDTVYGKDGVSFSGGQVQKIMLARALLRDAPILLMDEPTSGLDTDSRQKFYRLLQEEKAGRTILIVTHDLELLSAADQCIYLSGGKVRYSGKPMEKTRFIREVIISLRNADSVPGFSGE